MTLEDFRQIVGPFLLVVGSLLPIVNPLGSAPMFLVLTHGSDEATRQKLAAQVAFNSFVLLFASMVVGTLVLRLFGLSVPVVQVAGGAVLCALGWNLLNAETPTHGDAQPLPGDMMIAKAFYPLTLPLTVDPGAISVAITVGANHAHGVERVIIALIASILGLGFIAVTVWLAYRYAARVALWLGHTRVMVVLRLSAFIVLCIGVQISWNGIRTLAAELTSPTPAASTPVPPAAPAKTP
ncbi:MAG: MarC family protein [Casimicrobiaceae bacterium]